MRGAKILIIDDEKEIARAVDVILQSDTQYKFSTRVAYTGTDGVALARRWKPDLVLLDLALPNLHGYEVLRAIRAEQPLCRVCIMSISHELNDKLAGFEYGSDDYIIKPFSGAELLARVHALLRRSKVITDLCIVHKDVCLHIPSQTISRNGKMVRLTKREFDLLLYLMQRPGEVVSRDELLDEVWMGKDCYPNVVDAHIESLRRKIDKPFGSTLIKTAYRRGYYYEMPTEPEPELA